MAGFSISNLQNMNLNTDFIATRKILFVFSIVRIISRLFTITATEVGISNSVMLYVLHHNSQPS